MENNKKKIDVLIDGRSFTVVGNCSEEHIISMANYVDKKIKELTAKNDRLSQAMAATLAALNITDELYTTKEELCNLQSEAKEPIEKYEDLNNEIEASKLSIENLLEENNSLKSGLELADKEREKLRGELSKCMQSLDLKERELHESESMIKNLQEKIFDSQLEFMDTKKELMEIKKTLDTKEEEVK